MNAAEKLVRAARLALAEHADESRAPEMRRYMKSEMPFRGVPKPARAKLAKALFSQHPLPTAQEWTTAILLLWRNAEFREERYLAVDLTDVIESTMTESDFFLRKG